MRKIDITTAQNIKIEQHLAGAKQRFLAVLLDTLFLIIFYYLIFYLFSLANFDKIFSGWSFVSVLMLPYFLYYPLLQYWNNGQTLGKQLMKIRIVKTDNTHPRLGDFLIRWVIRLFEVNAIPGLALVTMLFSDNNQRLGDMAAGTVVVSEKKKTSLSHSIFEELEEMYKPVFLQVQQLKDRDVQLIKTVVNEEKKRPDRMVLKRLSQQIEKLLAMEKPHNMSYKQFINQVIKDYNYFSRK